MRMTEKSLAEWLRNKMKQRPLCQRCLNWVDALSQKATRPDWFFCDILTHECKDCGAAE